MQTQHFELFNKNRSRNTNEQIKWYVCSLKSTKFPEIRNISWMKSVIPRNLFKTYKTQKRYWYSCVTLRKILRVCDLYDRTAFCKIFRGIDYHSSSITFRSPSVVLSLCLERALLNRSKPQIVYSWNIRGLCSNILKKYIFSACINLHFSRNAAVLFEVWLVASSWWSFDLRKSFGWRNGISSVNMGCEIFPW